MLKLRHLLLALTLPLSALSSCGVGTLACAKSSKSPKPIVCDFFDSYTLNSETLTCVQKKVDNCLLPALPNTSQPCFLCKAGYVVDNENMKCAEVQAQSVKDNCEQYSNQSFSCLKCAAGYYVGAGACTPLDDAEITNCDIYASKTSCQVCSPGTYLQAGKCQVFSPIQNCYFHRNIKCERCQDEYFHNFASNPPFNESSFPANTLDFGMFVKSNPGFGHWTTDFSSEICQKGNLKNCRVYESFSVCKECEEGFYRNSSLACDRFQEAPLVGCDTYSTATKCSKCLFKFILDLGAGTCSPASEIESCLEYHPSEDKCMRCDDNLYLSQSGECTNERLDSKSISDCQSTNPDKDECLTCNTGFSLSSRKKFCYPDISNCTSQVQSNEVTEHHTCAACNSDFYPSLEKDKCVEAKILRCLELVSQKNECQKCEESYYFDKEKVSCINQFVENCAEYTPMTNTCVKCSNLYFLVNGNCSAIMLSEFCFESDGKTNSCSKCLPQYVKAGNTCATNITREMDVIDSLCSSNTETSKTSNCTDCGPGNYILTGSRRAVMPEVLTSLNCSKINPSNGQCLQCVENSSGDGSKCLPPDSNLTTECLQLKEEAFTLLGTANCAKCRDPSKKFLDQASNSCASRLNITINDNCEEFPSDDGDCLSCKEGFFPLHQSELRDKCYATADISGYTAITGCTIINVTTLNCFLCDPGRELSINKDACNVNAYTVALNFDKDLNITNPEAFTMINNCKTYHQLDVDVVKCSECNTGFVNIVNLTRSDDAPFLYDYHSLGINVGMGGFSLPVEKCEQYSNSYKTENDVSSITTDSCEVGIQIEGKLGYACIRCKLSKNGPVDLLTKDMNGLSLDTTIKAVTSCASIADITNTYPGIGYQLRGMPNYIPLVTYMRYSDCVDSSKTLIFNSLILPDGSAQLERFPNLTGVANVMYCASLNSGNSFYTARPNCQIFGFTTTPSISHSINQPPISICLACKPGFKAVVSPGTGKIQSCEPIVGCNNPTNGTYLNGCSDPSFGYKLDTKENNQLIMFDEVLQSAGVHGNCLVYSSDLTKCVVCKASFSLINEVCVDIANTVEYNCSAAGYGLNGLNLDFTLNANQRLMNYSYFLVNKFNIQNSRKTVCNTCLSGSIVGIEPDKNKQRCYSDGSVPQEKKIANCLKYKLKTPISCHICANGYIPNDFSGECMNKNSYANCLTVGGGIQVKCTSCEEEHALNDQGACIPSNCKRILNQKCSLCNDGYKIKEGSELYCELNMDSQDDCLAYSPTLKTCGKCKSNAVLYLFYHKDGALNVYKGFSCDPGLLIPSNLSGWKNYHLDEVFIRVDFDSGTNGVQTALGYIEHDGITSRLFSNIDPDQNPAKTHCFGNRGVENCIEDFLLGGVFCAKCENGFIIDVATNKCVQGAIQNCGVYTNATECQKCLPTHFLFNSGFCSPYTENMNCKEANLAKNECNSCNENFFINSDKACELRQTDLNCKDFKANENKCSSCVDGYLYQNSTQVCLKRNAKYCLEVDPTQDRCLKCKATYWMDMANDNVCRKAATVENCKEYEPTADKCKVCEDEFYPTEEGVRCKEKPDGVIGCRAYSDLGKCSGCMKDHFLANNQCTKVTTLVDECLYYQSEGSCMECNPNRFLNPTTKQCEETTVSNCKEFTSANICKTCNPSYILTWNDLDLTCESSNIANCLVPIGGSTIICIKCEPGKTLSTDRTKCESSSSIVNCVEYLSVAQCRQCAIGYIRSNDWKSCEKRPLSVSTLTTNCTSEVLSKDVLCDMCKPGFKKSDQGVCVTCGGEGCLVCGSGFTSCNVCQSRYHMNSDGKCVFNGSSSAVDSS